MRIRVPEWYRDAKFGIMVHWGLYSIPAFAETGESPSDLVIQHDWEHYYRHNPHAEWYQNSLRIGAPATVDFHRRSYRPGYPYEAFAERFNEDVRKWDPVDWADLFAEAGARYVVFVAKHHDGFLMWPSAASHREGYRAERDTVGDLASVVRDRNMRFGVYYSGLLDWTFQTRPIGDYSDLLSVPPDDDHAAYVRKHFDELIVGLKPDILWNDVGLASGVGLRDLLSKYLEVVPDGVVNDRWTQTSAAFRRLLQINAFRRRMSANAQRRIGPGRFSGSGFVRTSEYAPYTMMQDEPWEAVHGIGNSFGFNRNETEDHYQSGTELMRILADVVSKNGNLLLNVGPEANGRIPPYQRRALIDLAGWLRVNGEAIYGTRPWYRAEGQTGDGEPVRFTTRANVLYAILLDRPSRLTVVLTDIDLRRIPIPRNGRRDAAGTEVRSVSILGFNYPVQWRQIERGIEFRLPGSFVPSGPAVIAIRRVVERPKPPTVDLYTDVIG